VGGGEKGKEELGEVLQERISTGGGGTWRRRTFIQSIAFEDTVSGFKKGGKVIWGQCTSRMRKGDERDHTRRSG